MTVCWDPWRGCHKYSEGCQYCYIHKGDAKRGIDTNQIVVSEKFDRPIRKKKNGEYQMAATLVYLCFRRDFLLEEADPYRQRVWEIIKERSDCTFLFLTKRIYRFMQCVPEDWNDGYPNVVVCATVENQKNADVRLPLFQQMPIKHKQIVAQPLLTKLNIEPYLQGIEAVVVGGESDRNGRILDFDWVLDLRQQCIRQDVSFEFRQCATHFLKDQILYTLKTKDLMSQARKANMNYQRKEER